MIQIDREVLLSLVILLSFYERAVSEDVGDIGLGINDWHNKRCTRCQQRGDTWAVTREHAIGMHDDANGDRSLPVCAAETVVMIEERDEVAEPDLV